MLTPVQSVYIGGYEHHPSSKPVQKVELSGKKRHNVGKFLVATQTMRTFS